MEQMNVKKPVLESIERKQVIWYGHVKRMGKDRLPKKIVKWVSRENRKRRPRKTWIQRIRSPISQRGLNPN